MKPLAELLPYLGRYRMRLALGVLSILGAAVFGLISPIVVGRAVDSLQLEVSAGTLLTYGLLLIGVTLVQGAFSFCQRTLIVTVSRDVELDLRNDYFAHLSRLPVSYYQASYTGDLMARGTNDLQAIRMLCGPAIMYGMNTIFTATGALILMARIHLPLTALALCTMPLVAVSTYFFGQRIHTLFERVQAQFSVLSTRVQESLAGARVVRAYAQESAEIAGFDVATRDYYERSEQLVRWTSLFNPLLQALVGIGFVAVLWYGGRLTVGGEISLGEFVSFNFFLAKLVWPMIAIGWVINIAQRGRASLERLLEVLRREPAVAGEPPIDPVPPIRGGLVARDLTFTYDAGAPTVLEAIDFDLASGTTVAIVGRTGSGKSTLLSLVTRLFEPPPESLFLDGVDLRRWPLETLRAGMAMVPQETFLFSATLGDNVRFGRPQATDEEVLEAMALAGLDLDLAGFPDGLETAVGERGITLSGGQKQRVALARALVCRPEILLLDDCLSAVDTRTEAEILTRLEEVFEGRTVVFVSHRVTTVQRADLILVLDRGRIVERGTHAELLEVGGLYADLDRRQKLEEELAAV